MFVIQIQMATVSLMLMTLILKGMKMELVMGAPMVVAKVKMEKDKEREEAVVKAKTFSNIGMPVEELADSLMEAKANLSEKAYATYEASLENAEKVAKESAAFIEVGRSTDRAKGGPTRLSTTGGEATQKVLKKAEALVEKSDKLTIADAINKVLKEDPVLYEQYRVETAVRV